MWANHSGRIPKMSDHERFAHIAQRKWVIVSESLRSLTKNEGMSELLVFWANSSFAYFWANLSEFPALLVGLDWPAVQCSERTAMKIYAYLMPPGAGFRIQRSHLKNNVAICPGGEKRKKKKKKKKRNQSNRLSCCPSALFFFSVLDVSSWCPLH